MVSAPTIGLPVPPRHELPAYTATLSAMRHATTAQDCPARPPDHFTIDGEGRVRLRWHTTDGWTEAFLHRWLFGFPDGLDVVRDGDDMWPGNLRLQPAGQVRRKPRIDGHEAQRLRESGLSWGQIGQRLGCTGNGAKAAVRRVTALSTASDGGASVDPFPTAARRPLGAVR